MARSWKSARRQGNYIEPQTFCYLKEIELKITKIQLKTQQWVTIMRSRFTDKNKLHTKNNTNMLSESQDKPLMEKSWKYVWRLENYQTLNP